MTRRGFGEGGIYQRADGRWVAAVDLGCRNGRRHRKVVYGKTRREAREKLVQVQTALGSGIAVDKDRQAVEQFLGVWLDEVCRPNLGLKTVRTYETVVRVHLVPHIGRIRLSKLAAQDVQVMLNAVSASGRAPRTVQMIRAVLRQALAWAVRWGLVSRNVAVMVEPPRTTRHERRPLTPAEARPFVEAIRGDRLEALLLLALATGMRQGEILGLQWSEVDLQIGQPRVTKSLARVAGARLVDPKTERSRRLLALSPSIVTAIRAHRTIQIQGRLLAGSRWVDSGLVFTTSIGTPLDGPTVTRRLHRILAAAELPQITFHDLRHSCASLMLAQGVAPRVVMETLGHSDIRLTMNVYTHVAAELQQDAAARMERLLGS